MKHVTTTLKNYSLLISSYSNYSIRFLILFLIFVWTYKLLIFFLPEQRITLYSLIKSFIIASVIHLGLWISTTQLGKKYKYLTLFLMQPFLCLTPPFLLQLNDMQSIAIALLLNIITIYLLIIRNQ